jgi:hypothetical protein
MRKWIDIIALSEQVVYRDRFVQQHNTKKTVVAINPTKAEWLTNFPNGAAGVYCRDGRIVVGDGNCLDHSSILDYAEVPYSQELCRLQIHPSKGLYAELWIPDEYEDADSETIIRFLETEIDMTFEELKTKLKTAVNSFMGSVEVEIIPMQYASGPTCPEHSNFMKTLWD